MTIPIVLTLEEAKDIARIYIPRLRAIEREIIRHQTEHPKEIWDQPYLLTLKIQMSICENIIRKTHIEIEDEPQSVQNLEGDAC